MTKKEAITRIENHLSTGLWSETLQVAWQTLKTDVLAQQTNNTGSPKLPRFEELWKEAKTRFAWANYEPPCRAFYNDIVEYLERQLRAGA